MSFSAEVRAEMGRQGIRPTQLAKASGISEATISRKITNETRYLNFHEAAAIANVLGVPTWELLKRSEEAESSATFHSPRNSRQRLR